MRINKDYQSNLAGSLLVAHPGLKDPHFFQSVVLISMHGEDSGSIGVVVNQPLNKTMGEYDEEFSSGPLAHVPLYNGGPVAKDKIVLAAWEWLERGNVFRLYFGISEEKAVELCQTDPNIDMRAFLGYSSWDYKQLEAELAQKAWLVSSVKGHNETLRGAQMWKKILASIGPELLYLLDSPVDPSKN